jgi:hypothetical protein
LQSLSDIAMRLRIAGYDEAAATTYHTLSKRLRARGDFRLFVTNNRDHGGIVEYSDRAHLAWSDAFWHRDTQQFVSPVWHIQTDDVSTPSHDWNHVLESVCSLERTGRSSIPPRDVSRRPRLNRGWICVR